MFTNSYIQVSRKWLIAESTLKLVDDTRPELTNYFQGI